MKPRVDVAAELLRNPGVPVASAGLAIVLLANAEAKRSLAQLRDFIIEGVEATKARYASLAEIAREETVRLRAEQRAHELEVARARLELPEFLPPKIIPPTTKMAILAPEPMLSGFELQARGVGDKELAQSLGNHYEGRAHVEPLEKFRAYQAEFTRRFGDVSWYDVANRGVVRIVVPSPPAPAAPTPAPEVPIVQPSAQLQKLKAETETQWSEFREVVDQGQDVIDAFRRGALIKSAFEIGEFLVTVAKHYNPLSLGISLIFNQIAFAGGAVAEATGLDAEWQRVFKARAEYARRIALAISRLNFGEVVRLKREAIEKGLW